MTRRIFVPLLIFLGALVSTAPAWFQEADPTTRKVKKTEAEWRKLLKPVEFNVTRLKATEPAFSGKYVRNHAKGTYTCVCCGAPLFSSQTKFESGTGWPSFFRPIDPRKIQSAPDNHQAEARTEVLCMDCGAHLGHVFDDGPPPTGLRFCINSASLKFVAGVAKTKAKGAPEGEKSEPRPADEPAADKSAEGKGPAGK